MDIVDCLGRTRTVESVYPDGSYNCPFCTHAVRSVDGHVGEGCENPACPAARRCFDASGAPIPAVADAFRAQTEAAERRTAAGAERRAINAWSQQWHERQAREASERLAGLLVETRAKHACETCVRYAVLTGAKVKFVKHRGACPRQ